MDVVSLCDLPSNTVTRLPAIANAKLLLITNSPISRPPLPALPKKP